MAQFDVYQNPNPSSRQAYPYILDLQSDLIESLDSRIVAPLTWHDSLRDAQLKRLTPKVSFNNQGLLIQIPQLTSMPAKSLKNPIGTLSHLRDEIIAAVDFAITGI